MDLSELTKPDKIQSMGVGLFFWIWFFVLVPARSFKAGIQMEDPPIFFKLPTYKWISRLLLPVMLLGALSLNLGSINSPTALSPDKLLGMGLAIVLALAFLWGVPEMTAAGRVKRDESPGEWKTPMLVLFRWGWLGVILLAYLPAVDELMGGAMGLAGGIALPLIGVILFVLLWGLPGMMTAKLAEDDDPYAIASLSQVRWFGLPSWLKLMMQRGRGKPMAQSGPQKLCPSCMRPIDNVEQFESLKFDCCPHCGELAPPAFTIEQYITHFAEKVRELHSVKASSRKAPGKFESDMVQRILRALLTMAVRERATDVHLTNEGGGFLVRARTDGLLYTMVELPNELLRLMISTIKVQCNMDIAERRRPQDGSFKTTADDKKLDVRVNTSPIADGETASLRLLYRQEVLGSLDKLGMSHRNHNLMNEYICRPHGLILVTGPTGSGKSTTLYNALGAISDGKRNIITLEDPIEFKIEGLTQMQVDASKNFGFASGLRSIMRQDPDVIMVGEIRDTETAKMTIDAAMTGHLVFSTLHTIDTVTTISRLMDLGVDAHRHADALILIIAQRLVRLNCDACLETYEITGEQLAAMGLPDAPEKLILKRGRGCPHCHDTGYYEREGIYELLGPDSHLRELISNKVSSSELRREARRLGMRTLLEDGLIKAMVGRTTIDEVMRVTS